MTPDKDVERLANELEQLYDKITHVQKLIAEARIDSVSYFLRYKKTVKRIVRKDAERIIATLTAQLNKMGGEG